MREIKFRAWDGIQFIYFPEFFIAGNLMPKDWHDGMPVMQYTGLKDRNGVEIYDGDIVETEREYGGFDNRRVVKWTENKIHTGWNIGQADRRDVIGNTYKTPELMPKEAKP